MLWRCGNRCVRIALAMPNLCPPAPSLSPHIDDVAKNLGVSASGQTSPQ